MKFRKIPSATNCMQDWASLTTYFELDYFVETKEK